MTEKVYSRSVSTITIDDDLSVSVYGGSFGGSKRNNRVCAVPAWLRVMAKSLAVISLTVLTVLVLGRLGLSPLDRKFTDSRVCLHCALVNVSSGGWREERIDGQILCCVADHAEQLIPAPEAAPLKDPRGETHARRGAQLHMNTTALRGSPPRLAWSADMDDICYLNGIMHTAHVRNDTTLDCLEIPVEQNYLITAQLVFTNIKSGRFGPATYRDAFNTYYTVIRFSSTGEVTTIGKVYFSMSRGTLNERRHRSRIIKEPRLYTRSLHLRQSDKICITVENLDLIYADPIGSYFGIFEL